MGMSRPTLSRADKFVYGATYATIALALAAAGLYVYLGGGVR